MKPCGWLPPERRTRSQSFAVAEWHEQIGTFEDRNRYIASPPARMLMYELEVKATGSLMPRVRQITGSCVGSGAARAYCHSQCGDVVLRGDTEQVMMPFPFATYGVGREIAGMRRAGEGSFGEAQAKAVEQFGMLPMDSSLVPQGTITNGWIQWTRAIELQWSHPSAWPKPRSDVEAEASKYQMQDVSRATSIEGLIQAISQGYGVTLASMFGTRPRVEQGYLVGRWNDSWAHQMSCAAYATDTPLGTLFAIDNQWGDMHGACPVLGPLGVNGTFWMHEGDMVKVLSRGEVYVHSNTEGFPVRKIDFSDWIFS